MFDLASITEAGEVVKRVRLCVRSVRKTRDKRAPLCLLRSIYFFPIHKHNSNLRIDLFMCHPSSSYKHVHNKLWSTLLSARSCMEECQDSRKGGGKQREESEL